MWDLQNRSIVRTIEIPSAVGTMDVKLIPGDPLGRAFTAGMFDGLVYLVDTLNGTCAGRLRLRGHRASRGGPRSRRNDAAAGHAALRAIA